MDCRMTKGITPFVAGVVLLLLLLFSACTHTQQETEASLLYSPTLSELEDSPVSVPDEASGFGRVYETLGMETFSTQHRGPAFGFMLGQVGSFPTQADDHWIVGHSTGTEKYLQYYLTDPNLLPLKPGGRYELRFTYKVLETPDEGFEVLFFSNTGASRNDWIDRSIFFNEPAGSQGEAVLEVTLKDYSDYQVLMNIVNKGKLAVRDIQITDLDEGTVVAKEDTTSALPTHSPFIRTEGHLFIGKSTFGDGYSAFTNGYAKIASNPELFELSENTIYIFEFDWKMLQNKQKLEHVGYTRVYSPIGSNEELGGINLPGYGVDEGHFVGGFRTGPEDVPYILEMAVFDGVIMEIANLKVSVQKPVEQSVDEHPAGHLADTPFPRLGNIQTQFFEWVAHDGSGTAQGDLPLTNIVDLERDIAVSDVVVGMHPIFSSNDPGASLRLRTLNPGIVLLPMVPTHRIGIDSWMADHMKNSMVTAEVAFLQGIGEDWYLRDPKGNVLSEGEGYQSILLNVSPFCPYDANGRKYLDYWADTVVDLHVLDGSWDGVYLDQLLTKTHYGIKGAYAVTKVNADYNRNLKKDETLVWTHEMTAAASLTMLRNLRERFGDAELILTTPHFDYLLAPLSNGVAVSNFNLAWYLQNDPEFFSEAQWCWNVFNYWQIMDSYRDPSLIVLEATPMHPNWVPPENKREPDELDLRFQRFAIGTALLTDGFYEYDLVDARSAPYFFDEMLVDSSGASTTSVEGKGWLGKAFGPAEEIVGGSETVVSKPDPMLLGNKGSKSKILYRGRNTDDESRQFVLEFDWQLLETASNVPVVNVSIDNEWRDYFDLPGLLKGASGHVRFHTTVGPKEELLWKLDIGKKGVVEIKNLRVAKTDAGIFRRDFEHGLVLVNATAVEKEISLGDIRGALGRAGIRRIRGSLDVVTNNGRPVEEALTLPAHDAIVLVVN